MSGEGRGEGTREMSSSNLVSVLVGAYKSYNITSVNLKKVGMASRNIVIKNNTRCFKSALLWSLDFSFLNPILMELNVSYLRVSFPFPTVWINSFVFICQELCLYHVFFAIFLVHGFPLVTKDHTNCSDKRVYTSGFHTMSKV